MLGQSHPDQKYVENQLVQIYWAGEVHWGAFLCYRTDEERKDFHPECDCWCLIDKDIGRRVFDSKTDVRPAPPGSGIREIKAGRPSFLKE